VQRIKDLALSRGDDAEEFFLKNRDGVGATILHLCFLWNKPQHIEIAKWLMDRYPRLITARYHLDLASRGPSSYEGENILHLAIVNRDIDQVKEVVKRAPELLHHRAYGEFFQWSKFKANNGQGCYYGELPLLFAVSLAMPLVVFACKSQMAATQQQLQRIASSSIALLQAIQRAILILARRHQRLSLQWCTFSVNSHPWICMQQIVADSQSST